METKYFKKQLESGNSTYIARGEGIEIHLYNSSVTHQTQTTSDKYIESENYTEITRTEFMEAYLPIAEKMNNKIVEL